MKPFRRLALASIAACLAALASASPSAAQLMVGRLTGAVKNLAGQPIKAATVRAVNPAVIPSEFTATADQKGNWAILGMRGGLWDVTASAPGFESSTVAVGVAISLNNPKVQFVLGGTPVKGAMDGVDTSGCRPCLAPPNRSWCRRNGTRPSPSSGTSW